MNNTSEVGLYYYGCWYKLTYATDDGQPLKLEVIECKSGTRKYTDVWEFAKLWRGGFGGLDFSEFVNSANED